LPAATSSVMCTDQRRALLARQALTVGAHYVDITADLPRLQGLERLDSLARGHGATSVLSVGLSPGLTNLLAAQAKKRFDRLDRLDLIVMLATGDAHGRAAIAWTLDNLHARFHATRSGLPHPVRAFGNRRGLYVVDDGRTLPAFRFPFPEQRTLADTLGVPTVNSWLALVPAAVGYLTALAARTGTAHLLRNPSVRRLVIRALSTAGAGRARCGAVIQARGLRAGRIRVIQLSATGQGQNAVTGLVTARVVRHLADGSAPPGVHHIDQLSHGDHLIAALGADGLAMGEEEIDVTTGRQLGPSRVAQLDARPDTPAHLPCSSPDST